MKTKRFRDFLSKIRAVRTKIEQKGYDMPQYWIIYLQNPGALLLSLHKLHWLTLTQQTTTSLPMFWPTKLTCFEFKWSEGFSGIFERVAQLLSLEWLAAKTELQNERKMLFCITCHILEGHNDYVVTTCLPLNVALPAARKWKSA